MIARDYGVIFYAMEQDFLSRWKEHLLTHYISGAWRAPLDARMVPLELAAGSQGMAVAIAGAQDIARADASAATIGTRRATHWRMGPPEAVRDLAIALALERGLPVSDCDKIASGLLACACAAMLGAELPAGPRIILSTPQAALSACVLVDTLHRRGPHGAGLGLLYLGAQGDAQGIATGFRRAVALDWPALQRI